MKSPVNWMPILEMDDEDGNHTGYGTKINGEFYWITQIPDKTWNIETRGKDGIIYPIKSNLKSITSAKRYFSIYIKPHL